MIIFSRMCFCILGLLLGGTLSAVEVGEVIWRVDVEGGLDSPAIGLDGTVYIGSSQLHFDFTPACKFYALRAETGEKFWEYENSDIITTSPAIGSDGTVYFGSDDNKLYALSGQSGEKLWEFEALNRLRSEPVIGSDGIVYIVCGSGYLYAIKGSSGPDLNGPWPMFRQNAQGNGRAPTPTTITLPSWSWLETYPWIYNDGTWYYMKPIGSQNYLYNYTTQEWKLMGE